MKEFSEIIMAEQAPVSCALERVIQTLPRSVQEIASYSLLSGGKRLRPVLTLLCARLFSPEITSQNPAIYDAAIVLEMFHVASLLHDDVLDNADTRRGKASAHMAYGIRPCLLAGDALLAAGNRQMAEFAIKMNKPELIHTISQALLHTSTGEIEEIALVGKILPCMDDYLSVIEGKTAWILRSACEVGALMASELCDVSEEDKERVASFGLNLGMAFQIVDDALDFAPESVTGKPIGGDLRERKCTPPILMYAESLDTEKRKDFERKFAAVPVPVFEMSAHTSGQASARTSAHTSAHTSAQTESIKNQGDSKNNFTESEIAHIIEEIVKNKYPEKTKALADSYLEKAEQALIPFSNHYKGILLQALQYVRERRK